jgi:hypothetical protein
MQSLHPPGEIYYVDFNSFDGMTVSPIGNTAEMPQPGDRYTTQPVGTTGESTGSSATGRCEDRTANEAQFYFRPRSTLPAT